MSDPIQPLGDTVFLAEGSLSLDAERPAGVTDVVPAFGSVAVHFDPTRVASADVAAWLACSLQGEDAAAAGRTVEIPVAYGGEHGPDLEALAANAGLSTDEAVRRHAAGEYTVAAIGFQPGFPYLTGLAEELQTPRRASPRPRTPAGSVGIGGPYTGVYPSESPGGWNLIGQTPLTLYDAAREPRSLLAPGDRVRFRQIDSSEFQGLAAENARPTPAAEPQPAQPLFRVMSPGVQSTVQGLGRPGFRHLGVGPGGAMDASSMRQANLLVGNRPDAATVETTLVGPVLECLAPAVVGLAGAVTTARQARFAKGDRVDLRRLHGGARAYLALPGGVGAPVGRPLVEGDLLGAGEGDAAVAPPVGEMAGVGWRRASGDGPVLRVLRGPQADRFGPGAWERFLGGGYRVSPQSSRMGVRCEGPELTATSDEGAPSQPVCQGVVQVPPDGQPIVLGADAQTLGGYPVIAVVASVDWPVLGQLAPGDSVRFVEIDLAEAERLRQQAERELAIAAVGVRLAP